MISPGERFDAFTSNRLSRKEVASNYQLSTNFNVRPRMHAVFTFFHLLNRSVTSAPWIFYCSLVCMFLQLLACVIQPYNEKLWVNYPEMKNFFYYISILARFVPAGASDVAEYVLFGIYATLTIGHFVSLFIIIGLIQNQRDSARFLNFFFYYSFGVLPILKSSMVTITTKMILYFILDRTVNNFFLSLFALVVLLIYVFMIGFCAFAVGSSPSPEPSNPMSIWAPCTWKSVSFNCFQVFIFFATEAFSKLPRNVYRIIMIVLELAVFIPLGCFHISSIYLISFKAYQFVNALYFGFILFNPFIITVAFTDTAAIPRVVILLLWIFLPVINYYIIQLVTNARIQRLLVKLKNMQNNGDKKDGPLLSEYDNLNLGSSSYALFAVRTACVLNLDCFTDSSLLKYVVEKYHDLFFHMLYLSFFIQNGNDYLKGLIEQFLDEGPNFLESAIIFQLQASIQESSNELTPEISREISRQKVAGLKCEQILNKFWSGCYKGDLAQMSKNAYTLNNNLSDLSENWRRLVIRYPFSIPILKEYNLFLSNVGVQHKIVEQITKTHPKIIEFNTTQDGDVNIHLLHQAIEDAVDRRPLVSLKTTKVRLIISILLSFFFLVVSIVIGFIFMDICESESTFIYNTDTTCSLITNVPNLFQKTVNNEEGGREEMFNLSVKLDNAITQLLETMPREILKDGFELDSKMLIMIDDYASYESTGMIRILRLYTYFARCLPFVPTTDPIVSMMLNNTYIASYSVYKASDDDLKVIENNMNMFQKLVPIFYACSWGVIVIIMTPLVFGSLQNMKAEMKYLLTIYLTIPRSIISDMMNGNEMRENLAANRYNSASFVQSNPALFTGHGTTYDDNKDTRIADNLKMLALDNTSNSSVFPKWFQLKASLLFASVCIIILVAATLETVLFSNFVSEMMLCLRTLQYLAKRTIGCAVVVQGIASNFAVYPKDFARQNLNEAKGINNMLIFSDSKGVSTKFLKSKKYYDRAHNVRCDNESDMHCWKFSMVFDNFIIKATSLLENDNRAPEDVKELIMIYNDYLYDMMSDLHEIGYQYIKSSFYEEKVIILVLFFSVLGGLLILFIFVAVPFIEKLDSTIKSVKLPLKYIPPLKVPDLPKVMMYLQGEADWHKSRSSDVQSESKVINHLNIIDIPEAVFEADQTLLYANSAFFSLMGAPKEACIGLSIETIFSRVMMFKNCESHPFNEIIDAIAGKTKLEEGDEINITTSFDKPSRRMKNVMMKFSKVINKDSTVNYVLFIKDLTEHDKKEELTKQEKARVRDIKNYSTPLPLIKLMKSSPSTPLSTNNSSANNEEDEEKIKPLKFDKIPLIRFSISYATERDEYDGILAEGCQLFVRAVNDVMAVFSNAVRIVHEPPNWTFLMLPDENETDESLIIQTTHFALTCIERFTSSTTTFKISALVHFGDVLVIPMMIKVPVMECFGDGFNKLMKKSEEISNTGKLFVTPETEKFLNNQKAIVLEEVPQKELFIATQNLLDDN